MPHLSSLITPVVSGATALLLATSFASAQSLKVALCAAETTTSCNFTDPQAKLMATNRFSQVDLINVTATGTGTPSLAQLLQYDAIMCWTNSTPADTNAWGNVLADYVDAGGGVVVTVFANSTTTANRNIGGRWQNGYMVIIDRSGNASGGGGLGTVHQPAHPLMAGVTGFTGGTIGSRPNGIALQAGATLIAEWNNNKVLVAVGANPQRVDLGFYPPHSVCTTTGWTTGGDQLMANALVYVARSAAYGSFGTGCSGTLGVPTLNPAAGSRPLLGTTLTLNLGKLPLSQAVIALGFSNTQYGAFALPFDLTLLGMPGCSLRTEMLFTQGVSGSGNTATWSLPVPNNPALLGAVFYNQAFAFDPTANSAGLTVTNGGRGRVGI